MENDVVEEYLKSIKYKIKRNFDVEVDTHYNTEYPHCRVIIFNKPKHIIGSDIHNCLGDGWTMVINDSNCFIATIHDFKEQIRKEALSTLLK